MPVAVVALDFDPVVRIADRSVRLESIVVAAGLVAALLLAARLAAAAADAHDRLRPDDLLYLALAAVPGAVVGGRLGYGLVHLDYYGSHPGALLDPGQGGVQLGLGIVGGVLTAGVTARLLGEPIGRWLDVAALPVLLAIAVGKLGLALGGTGQGLPADLPWATAYVGEGPWGSLGPAVASHPSQLYEAAATAVLLAALVLGRQGRPARDGTLFLAALAGWAGLRFVVGATFREAPVLGPLRTDQLIAIGILAASLAVVAARRQPAVSAGEEAGEESRRGSIVGDPGAPAPGSRTTDG